MKRKQTNKQKNFNGIQILKIMVYTSGLQEKWEKWDECPKQPSKHTGKKRYVKTEVLFVLFLHSFSLWESGETCVDVNYLFTESS